MDHDMHWEKAFDTLNMWKCTEDMALTSAKRKLGYGVEMLSALPR